MSGELGSVSAYTDPLENPDELETFFTNAVRVLMVFAPSIGYFAQMREISLTHACEGFAPMLSFILLGSNTLRIYYWFGAQFEIALLFQSIVMLCVQLCLIVVVLRVQMLYARLGIANDGTMSPAARQAAGAFSPTTKSPQQQQVPAQFPTVVSTMGAGSVPSNYNELPRNPRQLCQHISGHGVAGFFETVMFSPFPSAFKNLTPILFITKYVTLVIIMGIGSGLVYWLGGTENADLIGYAALGIEGCLYLPQIHLNYYRKSTEGLTWVLLATWVIGDVAKLLYFIFDNQPVPFILCSCFQLTCDGILLFQVMLYRKRREGEGFFPSIFNRNKFNKNSSGSSNGMEGGGIINNNNNNVTGASPGEMKTLRSITGEANTTSSSMNVSVEGRNEGSDVIVSRGQYGSTTSGGRL